MDIIIGIIVAIVAIVIALKLLGLLLTGIGMLFSYLERFIFATIGWGILGAIITHFALDKWEYGAIGGAVWGLITEIFRLFYSRCPHCGSKNTGHEYMEDGVKYKLEGNLRHCNNCGRDFTT